MGRLRRPTDADGPLADLQHALADLHLQAGEPSTRNIARLTGALSHDTVHRVLTGASVSTWGPIELVVEALDGDVEAIRCLWIAVRRAQETAGG